MPTPQSLAEQIAGAWSLLSREDRARDGSPRTDPTLGPDALGILTYCKGRFAAQFMKRERGSAVTVTDASSASNNTAAIGGYDAYFGTYVVDEQSGEVQHRLEGALNAANVGLQVTRTLTVDGDRLVIRLETTTPTGEPVIRTLRWARIGRADP